ncbi:hypothetical protein SARC_08883 [Sphaeroforma arctica JP610]|uniref:ERCC4 domain-containing protein n=1 Tax=Sphaeroforma arctica JP610 TaxID=667725 RepID=A0A0L0FPQ6_9EUKA|nr:hypothetical protein SARC_08883 [Sphaeroforma arctica JP610]KNC78694.1 hypothetical protein SARC_08883 [Sphaeroforma arctica JP610]|eukprot:XP_014152596.1 hypothetical protein SARC_08883 [Sphaeroforma arctica JP610]
MVLQLSDDKSGLYKGLEDKLMKQAIKESLRLHGLNQQNISTNTTSTTHSTTTSARNTTNTHTTTTNTLVQTSMETLSRHAHSTRSVESSHHPASVCPVSEDTEAGRARRLAAAERRAGFQAQNKPLTAKAQDTNQSIVQHGSRVPPQKGVSSQCSRTICNACGVGRGGVDSGTGSKQDNGLRGRDVTKKKGNLQIANGGAYIGASDSRTVSIELSVGPDSSTNTQHLRDQKTRALYRSTPAKHRPASFARRTKRTATERSLHTDTPAQQPTITHTTSHTTSHTTTHTTTHTISRTTNRPDDSYTVISLDSSSGDDSDADILNTTFTKAPHTPRSIRTSVAWDTPHTDKSTVTLNKAPPSKRVKITLVNLTAPNKPPAPDSHVSCIVLDSDEDLPQSAGESNVGQVKQCTSNRGSTSQPSTQPISNARDTAVELVIDKRERQSNSYYTEMSTCISEKVDLLAQREFTRAPVSVSVVIEHVPQSDFVWTSKPSGGVMNVLMERKAIRDIVSRSATNAHLVQLATMCRISCSSQRCVASILRHDRPLTYPTETPIQIPVTPLSPLLSRHVYNAVRNTQGFNILLLDGDVKEVHGAKAMHSRKHLLSCWDPDVRFFGYIDAQEDLQPAETHTLGRPRGLPTTCTDIRSSEHLLVQMAALITHGGVQVVTTGKGSGLLVQHTLAGYTTALAECVIPSRRPGPPRESSVYIAYAGFDGLKVAMRMDNKRQKEAQVDLETDQRGAQRDRRERNAAYEDLKAYNLAQNKRKKDNQLQQIKHERHERCVQHIQQGHKRPILDTQRYHNRSELGTHAAETAGDTHLGLKFRATATLVRGPECERAHYFHACSKEVQVHFETIGRLGTQGETIPHERLQLVTGSLLPPAYAEFQCFAKDLASVRVQVAWVDGVAKSQRRPPPTPSSASAALYVASRFVADYFPSAVGGATQTTGQSVPAHIRRCLVLNKLAAGFAAHAEVYQAYNTTHSTTAQAAQLPFRCTIMDVVAMVTSILTCEHKVSCLSFDIHAEAYSAMIIQYLCHELSISAGANQMHYEITGV